jgi:hypothetical protein
MSAPKRAVLHSKKRTAPRKRSETLLLYQRGLRTSRVGDAYIRLPDTDAEETEQTVQGLIERRRHSRQRIGNGREYVL